MGEKSSDPQAPSCRCAGWSDIVECLEEFPPPDLTIGSEGDITGTEWVFRGLTDNRYELKPAIERAANNKTMGWAALEFLVLSEFKSRARMHLSAHLIPEDELTWLAQMQHYAIPTRLLDFTYSPFVALYFAVRDSKKDKDRTHVRLWAIDAKAVKYRFQAVASKARSEERKREGKTTGGRVGIGPDDWSTALDNVTAETHGGRTLIAESLSATRTRRTELNRQGAVCATLPPSFNPRLASQQGVFLLNCAEELSFNSSLIRMMGSRSGWFKTFDVAAEAISEIEPKLFQMNIHEQSLFPDIEGLAGLIRQKTRLHWK
jgi:hypothetical protein